MKEVFADRGQLVKWVGERIDEANLGDAVGIGLRQDGEIIAGVVYNLYSGPNICMHVAAVPGRRWMNKAYLYECFAYPFLQLKCNRVTGLVRVDNVISQKFCDHLGFKREGVLRKACDDGADTILYGMLREECRWLEIKR